MDDDDPDDWDFGQAAGVPVAFLTAWYGLWSWPGCGRVSRCLVHAATGGVGMAAVKIARYLGAEVFATASPAKHGVLAQLGVDAAHRASSRYLGFESAFGAVSGGRGVDVVLNALARSSPTARCGWPRAAAGSWRWARPISATPPRWHARTPTYRYQAFDLITGTDPDLIAAMLARLRELFVTGTLEPLPVRSWPLNQARAALRTHEPGSARRQACARCSRRRSTPKGPC